MERQKYLSIIVLYFIAMSVFASSYKEKVYQAYVHNTMSQWKSAVDEMGKSPLTNNQTRLELLNYQYGYIGWCIGQKKNEEAKRHLELAEKHIEILERNNYKTADLQAYTAAFYGYKIGLNPIKASYLGPKSIWHVKKALEKEPTNALAHLQYGNIYFYMPAVFGGSIQTASEYYLKVEKHYDATPSLKENNWNYINLLTILANTYIALDNDAKAMEYYRKIIAFEPNCKWIQKEILSKIKK